MTDAHELYERLGMIVMSGDMTVKQNKKGEWKKQFSFQSGWEKTPRHDYNKKKTGFAMLTGSRTGIIAIDIDDLSLECSQQLMDLMTECNMVQKTRKGFHYVYKYDARLKQTTGAKDIQTDIRSDGGCIFCEPTLAKNPASEVIASYEWIKTPFDDEELCCVPDEVVEFLAELDGRYVGREEVAEEEEEVMAPETHSETVSNASNPCDDSVLVKVLEGLALCRHDGTTMMIG